MKAPNKLIVEIAQGVENDVLIVNNVRVAGQRMKGGGQIVRRWELTKQQATTLKQIMDAWYEREKQDQAQEETV